MSYPLFGALDSTFRFPGLEEGVPLPFAVTSADAPGVLAVYDSVTRKLSFVLGNPYSRMTDTGIGLDVFHADARGFTGRWVDGSIVAYREQSGELSQVQGHFCARRIGI